MSSNKIIIKFLSKILNLSNPEKGFNRKLVMTGNKFYILDSNVREQHYRYNINLNVDLTILNRLIYFHTRLIEQSSKAIKNNDYIFNEFCIIISIKHVWVSDYVNGRYVFIEFIK